MLISSTRRALLQRCGAGAVYGGLLAGFTFLSACTPSSSDTRAPLAPAGTFKSLDISGANYGRHLDLADFDGQARHLSDFAGKVAVVFFGYTQCPDVCPTTLTNLAETRRLMGADGDRLIGVFVTVDPERDTAELLKAYVGLFDPHWIGLRGNAEQTAAAAKEFKVFYTRQPGQTPTSYTIDHTAASFVFDPKGRLRLYIKHAAPPAEVAADLKALLNEQR